MPDSFADLRIDAAFIAPMRDHGAPLARHSLLIGNGRILDVLPTARAQQSYRAAAVIERGSHLLLPGMINLFAQAELSLFRANAAPPSAASADLAHDGALLAQAEMLLAGTTCFVDHSRHPDAVARAALDSGMRAHIGLPIAAQPSAWAQAPAEYLSRALEMRDEYRQHPAISTCFALRGTSELPNAIFERLLPLADELEAGICTELLTTHEEIAVSEARHGARPLERLNALGVLSPAFTAVHMTQATAADIDLATSRGISVALCPQMNLKCFRQLPPVAELISSLNAGIGTASGAGLSYELFGDLRLAAFSAGLSGFDALSLVTRRAAQAINRENIGTLETGKWADVCCLDVSAVRESSDVFDSVLMQGGRDWVSDVWVGGRHLVADHAATAFESRAGAAPRFAQNG